MLKSKFLKIGLILLPIIALTITAKVALAYEMEWASGYGDSDSCSYSGYTLSIASARAHGWKDPQQETVRVTQVRFWASATYGCGDVRYEIYVNGQRRSHGILSPTPASGGTSYAKAVSVIGLSYGSTFTLEVRIWQDGSNYANSGCCSYLQEVLP